MRDNVGLWFWARPHNNALAFGYRSSCDCFGFFEIQLATPKREITCETVTSNLFVLIVKSAIQELNNVTVIEGEDTTLICSVDGLPVPSVSWTAVPTWSRSQGNIRELTNINRNDPGEYKCEASNVCGNDTKSLFLTVYCK